MDTLSNFAEFEPRFPLSEAAFAVECYEMVRHLGLIPFSSSAQFTRSLWLIFESRWGGRGTRAYLPFDSSLDLPDPDGIAVDCGVIASMMERPLPDEIAFVVLRRPGPAEISEADQYILRVLCHAAAGRQTAPWRFYVTGPDGVRRVR
jgi:hypothetical protein